MANVKDMWKAQEATIHTSKEACYTQNEIAVQVRGPQSAISKIITLTCSKRSNYGFKSKTTSKDKLLLNTILISNRFVNSRETSKARNDAGVAVSLFTKFWSLPSLVHDKQLKQKRSIWARYHQNLSVG